MLTRKVKEAQEEFLASGAFNDMWTSYLDQNQSDIRIKNMMSDPFVQMAHDKPKSKRLQKAIKAGLERRRVAAGILRAEILEGLKSRR